MEVKKGRDNSTSSAEQVVLKGKVELTELPPLPRTDRAQTFSSTHRFNGSISSLKIRVRLLEYATGGGGPLDVLEDRVFSWQEKVLKNEALSNDGSNLGQSYLHTYVDTDPFTINQGNKTVTRKWPVFARKFLSEDSDWEDLDTTKINLASTPTDKETTEKGTSGKEERAGNEKEERRRGAKEREMLLKLERKREEAGQKQSRIDGLLQEEEEKVELLLRKQSKHKRPSAPVSSFLSLSSPKARSLSKDIEEGGVEQKEMHQQLKLLPLTRRTRVMERKTRKALIPSQSMLIVSTIPHTNRKKEFVVCRLKAMPTAGVVTIKAPFGFRVIHANRQHVYRLSWELYLPHRQQKYSSRPTHPIQKNYGTIMDAMSFESVGMNEMKLWIMGEIVSASGFQSQPLSVYFILDTPSGWTNDEPLQGTTPSCYCTDNGKAHFSHNFSTMLSFSMDKHSTTSLAFPVMLFMVISINDSGRIRYEGYAYTPIPSTPGSHTLRVTTWRLRPRCIVDQMQDTFLDASPSLHDLRSVHTSIPQQEGQLGNKLGLMTEGSGEITIRFHVIHHTSPSDFGDQSLKLDLLEKMSHATILKSVQSVIEAFKRARNKALVLKNPLLHPDQIRL